MHILTQTTELAYTRFCWLVAQLGSLGPGWASQPLPLVGVAPIIRVIQPPVDERGGDAAH